HRDDAAGAALRADRRPGPARLHAGSAGLERGRGLLVRTARLQGARHQTRLLHRQPRGRVDHVEGPDRRVGRRVTLLPSDISGVRPRTWPEPPGRLTDDT